MENLYAKIGQRIVQIRHANNLTQYQLAEMLDISVKHCSAIEPRQIQSLIRENDRSL